MATPFVTTATPRFWSLLQALPLEIQRLAEKNYHLWQENASHPSLNFKRLQGPGHRFSVRIGDHYRAIAWKLTDQTVEWVWIGTHVDYDRLLKAR